MNKTWHEFLQHSGASITSDRVSCFPPNSVASEAAFENWLTDLSCFSVLQVSGSDADQFLQDQFCNDLRLLKTDSVSNQQVQLTGYCTPKGRLLTLFWIFQRSDGSYNLLLPAELAKSMSGRLSMFILRNKDGQLADVKIEDITSGLILFGVGGPNARTALDTQYAQQDFDADTVIESEGTSVVPLPGHDMCWIILTPETNADSLWAKLAEELPPTGTNRWELAGIQAAVPVVYQATSDKLIPQMLNLQAVDGLSFKKPCYPGQEIVARMQYLGKLKRHMHLVEIDGLDNTALEKPEAWPQVGSAMATTDDADAGVIVRIAMAGQGKFLALVVIKNDLSADSLSIPTHPQAGLKFMELPYALQGEEPTNNAQGLPGS